MHAFTPDHLRRRWKREDAQRDGERFKKVSPRWLHVLVPVKQEQSGNDRAELDKIAKLRGSVGRR